MNVLILAAGLGTRLLPLTNVMPKPLVPVCDKTLLDHQLDALAGLQINKIFANSHHLAEQVQAAADSRPIDQVYFEETILGTGGPLARLVADGHDDDLLVLNGDILHDVDLAAFVDAAKTADAPFSLVMVDNPAVNSVGIDDNGKVCAVRNVYEANETATRGTFAGISWYSSEAVQRLRQDHFSVVTFWAAEAEAGRLPTAWNHDGNWFDVGTPAGLAAASFNRLAAIGRETWGPTANGWERCINHTEIAESADLTNCIVMPDATVPSGTWKNAIFIPGEATPWQC